MSVSTHPSFVHLSVFLFPDDKREYILNGFSLNLVCTLILWRAILGLLMAKFVGF